MDGSKCFPVGGEKNKPSNLLVYSEASKATENQMSDLDHLTRLHNPSQSTAGHVSNVLY